MWNKFTHRSDEKELMDETDIHRDLLYKNLKELDFLNRKSGGHALSMKGIKRLITDHHHLYHVVDLGCGSGDSLKVFADWARKKKFNVQFTGVDMNQKAIDFLKIHCMNYPEINGITADYKEYLNTNKNIDIVHCSLFCHHLKDDELFDLFTYFQKHLKIGFIINDLRRHWMAYYSAWVFTRLANGSVLSKNDGPVSVLRGFKKQELNHLLNKAKLSCYSIQKAWAFRFLIVCKIVKL